MKNLKENNLFIPNYLLPHFRSNHAGETGAVYIYKGILMVSRDPEIRKFSLEHLNTESQHLKLIEEALEKKKYKQTYYFLEISWIFNWIYSSFTW